MAPDLLWDDVKNYFDPDLMGSLPDVSIDGTSVDDWQAVLDLVRSRGWACEYSEDGAVARLPRAEVMLARGVEASVTLRIWPVLGVIAIFRPYAADSIDFDVDLRELQGPGATERVVRLPAGDRTFLGQICSARAGD